jgi:ubiquinone/menaquinone biosynthesis C-methylase UbiE
MVDGIPVFALRFSQLTEVTSGVLASHRYNSEAPPEKHLSYTAQNVEISQMLLKILEASFPESKQRQLTLLDVGGGRGELAFLLSTTFDTAMIDVDLFSARVAQALQGGKLGFRVFCGDCSILPFESHSVDILIVKETAHHMAQPEPFFAELARVVRYDGIVLIVEFLQPALLSRRRTLRVDRMRQLGAAHHHFYLWDMTRSLRTLFGDTPVVQAVPWVFRSLFTKLGLSGIGESLGRAIERLPLALRLWLTIAGGGAVVLACRRPVAGNSQACSLNWNPEPMVDYPVELADVEPISEPVITNIRNRLVAQSR